ncbi:MAG: hypothetical protein ACRESF_11530 [Pseudomonas sp.]
MDIDFRDLMVLVLCCLLACVCLRWLLPEREVKVIQDSDYSDTLPRTFVKVQLRLGAKGPFLADALTGRALCFVGCQISKVQSQFRAADRRAVVLIGLEGVPIVRCKEEAICVAESRSP